MRTPLWVTETADTFWEMAGEPEAFPRDLRVPIANALPLTVVLLPKLRVSSVDDWLEQWSIPCNVSIQDRALRACLVARYGHGIVFLDGADPEDEQRFSLAHELAHFLRDYWQPRERVVERIGPAALEVLDGQRAARHDERTHAFLSGIPIGYHVHLMDRTAEGGFGSPSTDAAESGADLLAYELLAPATSVLESVDGNATGLAVGELSSLLQASYGLPSVAADRYSSKFIPQSPADSFVGRLRLLS